MRSSTDFTYADKTNYLTGVKHFSPLGTQNIGYTYGDINQGQMPDQIYKVSWNGTEKLNYVYDPLGRLTSKTILVGGGVTDAPNTLNTQYTYVDVGTDKTTTLVQSLQTPAGIYSYTYDTVGNITSVQSTDESYHYTFDYTSSFEYDAFNQLVRENNQEAGKTYTYSYVNGNITERKEYAYTTGTLGEVLDTKAWSYTDNTWSDLLTDFNGKAISYDEIGNPTTIGNQSLSWNGRQLQEITDSENTYTYLYNTDGQRVSKTVNDVTTEYFYNGSILAGQKTGDDTLVFMYDNTGDIFGFTYDGLTFYYVKNAQNDVVGLECGGDIVAYYFYDAWGNTRIINDAGYAIYDQGHPAYINPIRYRSYYYDNETGLYYLNSRYYSPELCRFLNADSVVSGTGESVQGYNMFAYGFNNPVNLSDKDGNWPKWATKVLIGVAVIAVCAAVTVATGGAAAGPLAAAVHCVAVGALKGAVIGAAVGAATGAAKGAVTHRIRNKTWKGAGKAALEEGATGFMTGAITGAITGGKNSKACFVAGTAVLAASGAVDIETIVAGDLVWSENPDTGERALKRVVQTFINETDELVRVRVNGEEIITTPEHPFYVPSKGWTGAIHLRAGDILVLQNGKYVIVEQVQHEILEHPIKVYNFEVEDFHTYYVGDSSVLVHNACGPKNQVTFASRKQAFNAAKRDIGVPRGQQPTVLPNVGRRGEINPGRLYDFGNGKYIRDDVLGHTFSDGSVLGPHFNTSNGLHVFYEP